MLCELLLSSIFFFASRMPDILLANRSLVGIPVIFLMPSTRVTDKHASQMAIIPMRSLPSNFGIGYNATKKIDTVIPVPFDCLLVVMEGCIWWHLANFDGIIKIPLMIV
jgi:hypothetical protein